MKAITTLSLTALFLLPGVGCAQEPKANVASNVKPTEAKHEKRTADEESPRRLEFVTWNSVKHELTWVISHGEKKGASYKSNAAANYEINMDEATMSYNGQTRRFSREEATNVHMLMDLIAKYAVDSTVWWDEGQGIPLDGKQPKDNKDKKTEPKKAAPPADDAGVLHVSLERPIPASGQTPAQLDQRIQALEQQLAQLKQIRQMMAAATASGKL